MRRKPGALLDIELEILEAGIELQKTGEKEFHGFVVAKQIKVKQDARQLTAYGTLYKALDRLERARLLESRWEDPLVAAGAQRPRRRFYHVTAAGERALAEARARTPIAERRPGLAPS